jgi:hypothetical protein
MKDVLLGAFKFVRVGKLCDQSVHLQKIII